MGRVAIARVASAIVAILLTWFGFIGVCTAAATSTVAQANYASDSSRTVVASATDDFHRAAPSTSARSILHIAAVWDGGGSVRVTDNTTTPDPTAGFTSGGELPQRAQASHTTGSPTLVADEGVFVLHRSRLAQTPALVWRQTTLATGDGPARGPTVSITRGLRRAGRHTRAGARSSPRGRR